MISNPLVTVLMPVYNGEKYVRDAIESVLNQTFTNFELLIINDGSSDLTEAIILSFKDQRIVYVKNEENSKLITTLNKGLQIAKGKYIARMDADDISVLSRLEKQVHFLENNPNIGLLGSAFEIIGQQGKISYPSNDEDIRFSMVFLNSFLHSSVIFKKELCLSDNLLFDKAYVHAEDYKLWLELLFKTNVSNLDEVLVKYRVHENQISQVHSKEQLEVTQKIQKEYLKVAGFEFTDREFELIQNSRELKSFGVNAYESMKVMDKLYVQNLKTAFFNERVLFGFLSNRYRLCVLDLKIVNNEIMNQLSRSLIFNRLNLTYKQRLSIQLKRIKAIYQKN